MTSGGNLAGAARRGGGGTSVAERRGTRKARAVREAAPSNADDDRDNQVRGQGRRRGRVLRVVVAIGGVAAARHGRRSGAQPDARRGGAEASGAGDRRLERAAAGPAARPAAAADRLGPAGRGAWRRRAGSAGARARGRGASGGGRVGGASGGRGADGRRRAERSRTVALGLAERARPRPAASCRARRSGVRHAGASAMRPGHVARCRTAVRRRRVHGRRGERLLRRAVGPASTQVSFCVDVPFRAAACRKTPHAGVSPTERLSPAPQRCASVTGVGATAACGLRVSATHAPSAAPGG